MSYKLDAYGNLINDREDPRSILSLVREDSTLTCLSQSSAPSLFQSRVQVALIDNIPISPETLEN